jgi:hypothetical protein
MYSFSRPPTEKLLYMSHDKGEKSRKEQCVLFGPFTSLLCTYFSSRKRVEVDSKDSMAVDTHSSRSRSAKTQSSKGKDARRLPPQSSAAEKSQGCVVVKAEPIHSTDSLQSP